MTGDVIDDRNRLREMIVGTPDLFTWEISKPDKKRKSQKKELQRVQPISFKGGSIEERFNAFHLANPHIYEMLRDYALQAFRNGRRKLGMKALYERLRWDYTVLTDHEDFKLCNDYTAYYARLIMEKNPELKGVFVTRTLRSKKGE